MKRAASDHPKLEDLAEAIAGEYKHHAKFARVLASGVAERLWMFCGKFTPQGNIGKRTDEQIARFIGWPKGDEHRLIELLLRVNLLQSHRDHRLIVWDWQDHCDETTKKTLRRKGLAIVCPDMSGPVLPEPEPEPEPGEGERARRAAPPAENAPPAQVQTVPVPATIGEAVAIERDRIVEDGFARFSGEYPNRSGVESACRWWISECSRSGTLDALRAYVDGVMAGLARHIGPPVCAAWADRDTGELQPQHVPPMDAFLGARPYGRSHIAAPLWPDHPPPWKPRSRGQPAAGGSLGQQVKAGMAIAAAMAQARVTKTG